MTEATEDKNTPTEGADTQIIQRPGKMKADHFLTIETRMAQQMYNGRERTKDKEYITGFNRFGGLMTSLYLRAAQDDPYFDLWLINIETLLLETLDELKALNEQLTGLLNTNKKIEIAVPESINPIKVRLGFRNPYAFKAADLIVEFDEICKLLNAGRHTARLTHEQFHHLRQRSSKAIRRLFEEPLKYPTKGMIISREEYRQGTRKALEAIEKWGALDDDIVAGTRRGAYAPPIRKAGFNLSSKQKPKRPAMKLKNSTEKPQN